MLKNILKLFLKPILNGIHGKPLDASGRFSFDLPPIQSDEDWQNLVQKALTDAENLALAIEALHKGGNLPCILNAANEIAVYAFLRNRIGFLDMTEVVEQTMQKMPFIEKPTLEQYFESDGEARSFAASLIHL